MPKNESTEKQIEKELTSILQKLVLKKITGSGCNKGNSEEVAEYPKTN